MECRLKGDPIVGTPVTDIRNPEQLLTQCYRSYGAAYVRRLYLILDRAIGQGIPLIMPVAGPVTVSDQHRIWLNPMIEAGWIGYITVTDAICYHDGHDLLQQFRERPIYEVPIEGFDEEMREQKIIRVTNTGFDEDRLFEQDAFISAMLRQPEFQRKMTGTEFRNRLGQYYAAQEEAFSLRPSLLGTCYRHGVPVFVGAPGDGSAFLNSVKLWALSKLGVLEHKFEIDVHAEVFESCAYHYWGLFESDPKMLAVFILGGGVPKNFSLQPEPTLSQIFMLPDIRGYDFDAQIVGAPVTYGDLTGCKAQEAHTWGKVSKEALVADVESLEADYTTLIPLLAWALLDKRRRLINLRDELGDDKELQRRHPEALGYIRTQGGFRLYERREELVAKLFEAIGQPESIERIKETLNYPLQLLERISGRTAEMAAGT